MFDVNAIMKARDTIVNAHALMSAYVSNENLQAEWKLKISETIQHFAQKNNLCLYDLILHMKMESQDAVLGNAELVTLYKFKESKIFFAKLKMSEHGIIIEIQPCDNYNL